MKQKKSTLTKSQNRILEENLREDHDLMVELSETYARESKRCDICDREYIDKKCWEFCPLCGYRLTLLR